MRRVVALTVTLSILALLLISCGGANLPKEGVFYCEEVNMSIDFSKFNEGIVESVKKYNDDGLSFYFYRCEVDGDKITISSKTQVPFISGEFSYSNDEFVITEDGGDLVLKFLRKE